MIPPRSLAEGALMWTPGNQSLTRANEIQLRVRTLTSAYRGSEHGRAENLYDDGLYELVEEPRDD